MTTGTAIPTATAEGEVADDSLGGAVRAYVNKVRGGDVGSLPAILGFVALVIFFSAMRPDSFASTRNAANLLNQAAPVIFIAMGLIFVLAHLMTVAGMATAVSAVGQALREPKQGAGQVTAADVLPAGPVRRVRVARRVHADHAQRGRAVGRRRPVLHRRAPSRPGLAGRERRLGRTRQQRDHRPAWHDPGRTCPARGDHPVRRG